MKWDFWSGQPPFVQKNGLAEVPLTAVNARVAATRQANVYIGAFSELVAFRKLRYTLIMVG